VIAEFAFMQGYNLEGERFTSPPRNFALLSLPLLLFQLVDAGYTVSKDQDGLLLAVSTEFFEYHKQEYTRLEIELHSKKEEK
jgi:hypothetical protein